MNNSSLASIKIKAKLLQKKKNSPNYALKDAYASIAKAAGYSNWKEMKDMIVISDLLNPPRWSAIWKAWFSSKTDAIKHLKEDHFLLPYRKHFFICTTDYINALGINSNDPDLIKIGNDWTSPKDQEAFERILKRIENRESIKFEKFEV
ncbi:hypothetical protein M899_2453 [Bacteriovorax sp. BSW11_IV]|uniref:hypothetical protein n=1 Tax=Bacteriovorax sp. BSW11_IV TaxID=1353529 RepID=UPI00038A22AB|nr:hypothetical protein [Bacteriovorax sp. BSW11_IV]EQC44553.1 hypothetical protein M899_2453 [Bacteriovorax sp. BSW11_IV]